MPGAIWMHGYPGQDPTSRQAQPGLRAEPAALCRRLHPAGAQEFRLRIDRASTHPGHWTSTAFAAIIAPSYADIFFNNSFKNGLLPIVLPEAQVGQLFDEALAFPGYQLTIDLERQVIVKPAR
jgi:3-isopropylmalate/(R)-2-methylmalate dehydratase small subunit